MNITFTNLIFKSGLIYALSFFHKNKSLTAKEVFILQRNNKLLHINILCKVKYRMREHQSDILKAKPVSKVYSLPDIVSIFKMSESFTLGSMSKSDYN